MYIEAFEPVDSVVQYYCNVCRQDMNKWSELCPNCKAIGHTWARNIGDPLPTPCINHIFEFAYKTNKGLKEGWLCRICGEWQVRTIIRNWETVSV